MKDSGPWWGAFALLFVLFVVMGQSFARTGGIGSITEELGKLLVASSAVSFFAAAALGTRTTFESRLLAVVFAASLTVIFLQASLYQRQRSITQTYLARLISNKIIAQTASSQTKAITVADPENLTGRIIGELIDADFIPVSMGNDLSGEQRDGIRADVAEWLTKVMGLPCTKEELLVPSEQRRFVGYYKFLGSLTVVLTLLYLGALISIGRKLRRVRKAPDVDSMTDGANET